MKFFLLHGYVQFFEILLLLKIHLCDFQRCVTLILALRLPLDFESMQMFISHCFLVDIKTYLKFITHLLDILFTSSVDFVSNGLTVSLKEI